MRKLPELVAAAALALLPVAALSQPASSKACDPAPARATSVQGAVESSRAGDSQWRPVRLHDSFCPGDAIRVGPRSRADIMLLDQSVLRLNANSGITVEAPKERNTGVIDLLRGAVHFLSRGPRSLEVKTPFTVAGVRGTEFLISVEPQQALLTVFEGTVVAESPSGSLTLTDGRSALAAQGRPPVERVVARPRDAVHWALYYPPVIYAQQAAGYPAQALLAVGSVDEARADVGRALQAAPSDASALAVQSIMALVQGDTDQGLQLAQSAAAADPSSAAALLARSYAEQARFDLPAARASAQRAVEAEPRNALAWARLAELHASFGELDKADRAARRAVELDPNVARTQTVLGFAQLSSTDIAQAKASFEKAIAFDQSDPLPRLGLGLAKIRDGDLDAGSRELEVAASLDPGNSLVRSYLGKAYYEEKRSPLDERELRMAQQLDPRDPTPWFYDAIAKQTTNRPVEALQSMENAIERNDNRAIYRSRLLLDSDAAARSANLARLYSELGFQQLALVEGWKSLNTDPTNFSAHRFLADSYAVLPRHEIARVSELLQSQLLQPVNRVPLQPRLGESNLFLISAAGPGILGFNEFNPLFNRDGWTLQASTLAGEHDTRAAEGVVSGVQNRVSFSAGAYGFRTNGFRTNADQRDDIANAFVQVDLTPRTSIQAEFRHRDTKTGDLPLRFFPEDFFPGLRNTDERDTYRAGLRHAFSPGSIVLGSFTYQDATATARDNLAFDPFFLAARNPERASGGEVQHLFRSSRFKLTSGIGYFDVQGRFEQTLGFLPDIPLDVSTTPTDLRHLNLYAYSHLTPLPRLTLTLGASADSMSGDSPDVENIDQVNPKLGITWEPVRGTTLRAAAFRTLKRTLITNQTLEPTQVAGFNQFFDDPNGTDAKRYGAAVDQKFGKSVFAGIEVSARKLEVPHLDLITDPTTPSVLQLDARERVARAYAFWTPSRFWALRAEYLFERFEQPSVDAKPEIDTHRVPLGVAFFHPSGLSASLTATYYDQSGDFQRLSGAIESGRDKFWTADAAIGYRLPRRYGFVSVGARNLFDEEFRYYQTDLVNPTIWPKRLVFVQATLALP